MAFAFQRRRGTTTQHASFTGLAAELTVDTTKNTVVVHNGSTAGGFPLSKQRNPYNAQTGTTYTLVVADADGIITATNASAITVTVPSATFAQGDRVTVIQSGAGQVTFAGSGVTLVSNGATSASPKTRVQYSAATIIFTSSTTATVVGDIA